MKKTLYGCVAAAAFVAFAVTHGPVARAAASPVLQADSPGQAGGAAQDPLPVTGELTRVTPDSKMFSVKTSTGAEMQFKYSDSTIVTGAQKNVAGLATERGSEVTVSYRVEGGTNMATKIDIHAAGKSPDSKRTPDQNR